MTAIAGFWRLRAEADPAACCGSMLAAQRAFGPDGGTRADAGELSLGRALFRILPEDRFDSGPVIHAETGTLLVADVRIDNRDEIVGALGLDRSRAAEMADSALLLEAWLRWGEAMFERVVGDYALALWDAPNARLLLARDALGQRPLHYHAANRFFAFASMPSGLNVLGEVPGRPDPMRIAELVSDRLPPGPESFFAGVLRVEPGHVLIVTREGVEARRFWDPPLDTLRLSSDEDYVEAFRAEVDRAVEARLRCGRGGIASHLSAGFDSSSVAATAARALARRGERLTAFTHAPREDFGGAGTRNRVADEVPGARLTAALYANVDHVVVRADDTSPLALLDEAHALAQAPVAQPINNVYWSRINAEAAARGARVMLTGQYGNSTISAAGLWLLADLVREGRFGAWAREARALVRKGPARWRGILANSFGPWTPPGLWGGLNRLFIGTSAKVGTPYLLRPEWAARIEAEASPQLAAHPAKNGFERRLRLLQTLDQGNFRKRSLAAWGIDERDPTADRRLVEFCLRLPHDKLLKNGQMRPLARAAMADRLPREIVDGIPRGLQMPEWYRSLRREDMIRQIELAEASPAAASLIDTKRLRAMVDDWPAGEWNDVRVIQEYRFGLMIALAAAHFVRTADAVAA